MSTQGNSWSEEELELLTKNIDVKLEKLLVIFEKAGFERSYKAIRDKRSKLNKKKPEIVQPSIKVTFGEVEISGCKEFKFAIKEKKSTVFETTLVVPDAHVDPGQNLNRFKALANFANIKKPNNIVFMGDFGNFDSLSKWDAGKEASHGKRYKEDVKACKQALSIFIGGLSEEFKPRIVFLGGNHDEGRIEKYIETHPQLRGHMDIEEDLCLKDFGIEFIHYKKLLEIQGTLFTHAVMTAANQPVSGKSLMTTISGLLAKSIVVGHHHKFETMSYYRHGADDVSQVLLCGLFTEETPNYAEDAANSYNRCICLLTHTGKGRFDIEQVSLKRLKAQYL